MRERKEMDTADELIVRYALGQRRDKLPKDLAGLLDSPTWSAQNLMDALHERVSRDPELGRHFLQLLAHHPHSARVPNQHPVALPPNGAHHGSPGEAMARPEIERVFGLKREVLIARVEAAFFPETEADERIDLDAYIKLMQALSLAKSLSGLKGIERELNHRLKTRG